MIELLVTACLFSATPECRDFPLLYDPVDFSLMACVVHGQREIAAWSEAYPGWRVSRWRCGFRAPGAADI